MENSLEKQKKKSWAESFVLPARERLRLLLVAMFSGEQRRSGSAPNVSRNKLQRGLRNESGMLGFTKQKQWFASVD
jgi:hypothetical protein